ncbi:glycosyltransferase family 1 protein [Pseudomonas oryzihabitans]|uniref:glycosyltransferase family 4 protein n=1 Tax=Pseudomonas oryzihabitans TaxID=47885 RepID=UPI002894FFA9|nr:glycosyltransferase family 1 protein [Pseudomonas oryzihabitans]MDT3721088.1 glycosyltransferase family 1 protein [Pseudomonas oryzihabitans]
MIIVNSRFITQDLRGVQRFAECISLELAALRTDLRFVSPPGVVRPEVARRLNIEIIGTRQGQRWEQWDLPNWLRTQGNPLLLSLCSTAPLRYANQIVTHHDINYVRFPESYSWKFRTSYRCLIPLLLKRASSLITVSAFSKQEISRFYRYPEDSISVVPNAVAAAFTLGDQAPVTGTPYLLAVSSPSYHKNFSRLLEAFAALPRDLAVELRIVGDGHAVFGQTDLATLATQDPRVKLLGRIDDDELARQYRQATAFVFPSLYEGFGIPPLEAQACGCPVISADTASMPEVLRDSAHYFDPHDVSSITAAMWAVLLDPALRTALRAKGLANIQRFSWKTSAGKVSELLDAALAATPNAAARAA